MRWVNGKSINQAEQDGALLLIDEANCFLQDRRNADRRWEVSLVNEMLTQMESFADVFIASTNLMAGLDQLVSHRRQTVPSNPRRQCDISRRISGRKYVLHTHPGH